MNTFNYIGRVRPRYSRFNWSNEHSFSCDMGELIPFFAAYLPPGGRLKGGVEAVVRLQPMNAPVLHEINAYFHFFFVPLRIIDPNFENFISGGVEGTFDSPPPLWPVSEENKLYSLFDYMHTIPTLDFDPSTVKQSTMPVDWKRRAYNAIWNYRYRDENLQEKVQVIPEEQPDLTPNFSVLHRAWEKDYFTSALPFLQRGPAIAFPISGDLPITIQGDTFTINGSNFSLNQGKVTFSGTSTQNGMNQIRANSGNLSAGVDGSGGTGTVTATASGTISGSQTVTPSISGSVSLQNATTFDVNDVRRAFQIQKFMERNARAGVRYSELIQAHFDVKPLDSRLQEPEYLGGSKTGVIISEVLQTSATSSGSTPQGNMAGHGLTALRDYCFNYRAPEFGVVIGLCSIMPRSAYCQGINRTDLVRSRYDMVFPEFVNLSEQPVYENEIYFDGSNEQWQKEIFGFQGRYNEYRSIPSKVSSDMRFMFDYWNLARKFDSPPDLNASFVECNPSKRIFAVQNEKTLIVTVGTTLNAILPIPKVAEPGFVDHH